MASEKYNLTGGLSYEDGKYYRNGADITNNPSFNAMKAVFEKQVEEQRRAATKQQGTAIADKQSQLAAEFKKNLPTYTGLLQDQSKKTIQRNLAENISDLRQQSSSRGFLKGSATQKQQAEAQALAGNEIMSKDADIEDALKSQAQQFENEALANKMSMQGSANQATIDALRQNILDTQRQSELWKALGGAAGSGIGAYYGRKGAT